MVQVLLVMPENGMIALYGPQKFLVSDNIWKGRKCIEGESQVVLPENKDMRRYYKSYHAALFF